MRPTTIEYVRLEAEAFRTATRDIIHVTDRYCGTLANIGATTLADIGGVLLDAPPEEMRAWATRVRGAVLHALHVVAELQAQAGRLEQLAAAREAAELAGETDEEEHD